MSYSRLLNEYAYPENRKKNQYVDPSEKRLRWLKHEAFGNSKFSTTAFNVRHAHISNRNLQQKLSVQLSFYANKHGKYCNKLELGQEKLWNDKLKREQNVRNYSRNALITPTMNNIEHKKNLWNVQLPFSTTKEYTVFQHIKIDKNRLIDHIDKNNNKGSRVDLLRFDAKKKNDEVILSTWRNISPQN